MKTNRKGISLIVLAITIVVMIILATAIILSLSGKDVIATAKEAATASDMANVKHVVSVAKGEWELGEVENYTTFEDYAKAKVQAAGYKVSGTGAIHVSKKGGVSRVYQDAAGYTALIPAGYTASEAKGEDTIANGLVIYEGYEAVTDRNVKEARKTRNQFVWVPVPEISAFVRKNWDSGVSVNETKSYDISSPDETQEYAAMYNSVKENGGFYIARYEAGKEGTNTLVSRKNVEAWNRIKWQAAKELCSSLGTDSAVGHLIYGEEWTAALTFISENYPQYVTNADGKGWFASNTSAGNPNNLAGIDVDEDASNRVNNIYDMAGNLMEWSMEWSDLDSISDERVTRGTAYMYDGTVACTGGISISDMTGELTHIGFRPALYLK